VNAWLDLIEKCSDKVFADNSLVQHKVILRNRAIAAAIGKGAGSAVAGAAGGTVVSHLIQ